MTVKAFLVGHINALSDKYRVTVVVNIDEIGELQPFIPQAIIRPVKIQRKISLWYDLKALLRLYRLFRQEHFAVVHSVTPKAGLLAMSAARLACIKHRLHTFTGQVWVTRSGIARLFLKTMDRFLAALTSCALVDSPSQRDFLLSEGVLPQGRGTVLGAGSIAGVDCDKFVPDPVARSEVRESLTIPQGVPLFLFLGRLNRDKGVLDLAEAFLRHCQEGHEGWLLLVGPDEESLRPRIETTCAEVAERIRFVDYTTTPERFMAAADIFCLPSYREGFGSVVIEAASCGVPAIGSRIYGVTDAIVDGETGLMHAPGDVAALQVCMSRLAQDEQLRQMLGNQARNRARTLFTKEIVSRNLVAFYRERLA